MKMTKQEIAELLLKANDDLSNIEACSKDGQVWVKAVVDMPYMLKCIIDGFTYRIKPEPEYVPYTQYDAKEFLGEKFVNKKYGYILMPLDGDDEGVFFCNGSGISNLYYSALFQNYTKLDGTPAGRRVE
jgi:hypothetical protein